MWYGIHYTGWRAAETATPGPFRIVEFARSGDTMRPISVTSPACAGDGSSQANYLPLGP